MGGLFVFRQVQSQLYRLFSVVKRDNFLIVEHVLLIPIARERLDKQDVKRSSDRSNPYPQSNDVMRSAPLTERLSSKRNGPIAVEVQRGRDDQPLVWGQRLKSNVRWTAKSHRTS